MENFGIFIFFLIASFKTKKKVQKHVRLTHKISQINPAEFIHTIFKYLSRTFLLSIYFFFAIKFLK